MTNANYSEHYSNEVAAKTEAVNATREFMREVIMEAVDHDIKQYMKVKDAIDAHTNAIIWRQRLEPNYYVTSAINSAINDLLKWGNIKWAVTSLLKTRFYGLDVAIRSEDTMHQGILEDVAKARQWHDDFHAKKEENI